MKQTIYDIRNDYVTLYELALDEERGQEFEQVLRDTKESLDFELEEKAYSYAKVCKNLDYNRAKLEGQAEFLKKELENIQAKIKSNLNNKKRILNTLHEAMQLADIKKFKNEQFNIYQSKNISVVVTDLEKAFEKGYATTQIKADSNKLKEALKLENNNIDFANLKETKFLVIK